MNTEKREHDIILWTYVFANIFNLNMVTIFVGMFSVMPLTENQWQNQILLKQV